MKNEPVFEYHIEEAFIIIQLPYNSIKRIKINYGWSCSIGYLVRKWTWSWI